MPTADELIRRLNLQPHPKEGGFFRETYRSSDAASLPGYPDARSYGTAIYYLLKPGTFSALHRLRSDEIFHFYLGGPVRMLQLWPDGSGKTVVMGPNIERGEELQVVVPRGVWQGTCLEPGSEFALLGCTVAPGFDYADYEHGTRADLIRQFPDHRELINRLTTA